MVQIAESIKTIKRVIEMLPCYADLSWRDEPDNVKCDIDIAKRLLIDFLSELTVENEKFKKRIREVIDDYIEFERPTNAEEVKIKEKCRSNISNLLGEPVMLDESGARSIFDDVDS